MQIDSVENLGAGAYGRPQSSTSLSPPTSGLVVPQPLNPRLPQNMLGGQLGVSGRKYPCKMCPQVSQIRSPLPPSLSRRLITSSLFTYRLLTPRQTCSSTLRSILENQSRTSVTAAGRRSPTAPTSRSTLGSTLASSPTDVKYVNASSPSSHISSSTSGLTRETSPTSAEYQVTKLSSSSRLQMKIFHFTKGKM